jgi:hypothetical protein
MDEVKLARAPQEAPNILPLDRDRALLPDFGDPLFVTLVEIDASIIATLDQNFNAELVPALGENLGVVPDPANRVGPSDAGLLSSQHLESDRT